MSIHIDMTPMVDLAFLLLTFFVLTVRLSDNYMMEMEMPEETADPPAVKASRVLSLILAENNTIYWSVGSDQPTIALTDFSATGVRKILLDKQKQISQMVVLIKPSDKSCYKNIVDILDEMIITKTTRYFLVDETPEDQRLIRETTGG